MSERDPKDILDNNERPNVGQALTFFQRQGWSPAAASGIVANLFGENDTLDPGLRQQPSGPGYGIAQWEGPRQQDFQNWAGKPIQGSSLLDQLGFVQHELTTTPPYKAAGTALQGAQDPAKSALTVLQQYEGAKDHASDSPTAVFRMRAAQALYDANFPSEDEDVQPQQVTAQPITPQPLMPQMFPMPQLST